MKIAIAMLVLLGIVAAGAATMFVQSTSLLRPKEPPAFDVLVAAATSRARPTEVRSSRKMRTGCGGIFQLEPGSGKTPSRCRQGQPLASSQVPKTASTTSAAACWPLIDQDLGLPTALPRCVVDVLRPSLAIGKRAMRLSRRLCRTSVLAVEDDSDPEARQIDRGAAEALLDR
jgi:hypothetical protein